jgi:hypothetical protein
MPWKRRAGHLYFYVSERIGRQVVSHYVGRGEAAAAIEELVAEERAAREAERAASRRERALLDEADRATAHLCLQADLAARAALLGAGYHQHHRGEWRKRRGRVSGVGENNDAGRAGGGG